MSYWLMKSDVNSYSISDLQKEKQTVWDGVRNYQARNFLRQMKKGDLAFFYHSNTTPPGIVGIMRIVESNVIDPTQFDPQSRYYDAKSSLHNPRWQTVTVEFVEMLPEPIFLATLKQAFSSDEFLVVRTGNRLSVMPVSDTVAQIILSIKEDIF